MKKNEIEILVKFVEALKGNKGKVSPGNEKGVSCRLCSSRSTA